MSAAYRSVPLPSVQLSHLTPLATATCGAALVSSKYTVPSSRKVWISPARPCVCWSTPLIVQVLVVLLTRHLPSRHGSMFGGNDLDGLALGEPPPAAAGWAVAEPVPFAPVPAGGSPPHAETA